MDFSALNLRIKAIGERDAIRALENIDRKSEESERLSKRQVDDAVARYNRMYGDQGKSAEIAADRSVAAAERAAVQSAAAMERMQTRSANATQGVARGFEMLARTGNLTGRSLDAVMSHVSHLALGFGAGGALVGAIGIATSAIVEMFMRTRREMEKTQTEFNQRLSQMANSYNLGGLAGRDGMVTKLMSGDPFASAVGKNSDESDLQFLARSEGIEGLRNQLARDRAKVPKGMFSQGSSAADKVRETKAMLDQMVSQYDRAMAIIKRVSATVVDETSNGINIAAGKKKFSLGSMPGVASLPGGMTGMGMGNLNAGLINDAGRSWRQQLIDLKDQYVVEAATAKTVEDREHAYAKIAETMKKISALSPWNQDMAEKGDGVKVGHIVASQAEKDAAESAKRFIAIANNAAQQMTATLANTVSRGFAAAFSPGGGAKSIFKAMGSAILEGLGGMFIQIGEASLAGLAIMAKIKEAILAFAPEVGIAAALGMIALGAAMQGAGARVGASTGGGSGYSQSYNPIVSQSYASASAPPSGPSAAGIATRQSVVYQPIIIGPNDPVAQRGIMELMQKAGNRGGFGS